MDNDPSLDNVATQKACDELGILLDMVGIGAHGSAGTVERTHLTLMDRTRAELIQNGEPVATLPYVLLHAARIQNCMPKAGGNVPWTIVHGEPPRFGDCFHSIGAAGVIRILTPKSKTSARAVKGLYYGHSNDSQTVMLIKVQTKDAHGNIAARVVPTKDFWFESDPEFPSGDQVWDFVSSNWVPKFDTVGRELFTDRHHALHCSKCNLGGQLLECDYCDCVWHKKCADITRRINPEELFRCPTCRTRDEDTMPVTSIEQRRAAAIARNVELTVIRKQAARDSQMRKTAAKVLRAQNKKKKEELAEAARVAQNAAWEQQRPARERAAAARTRASRSAEAAETAAAPGGTPLRILIYLWV